MVLKPCVYRDVENVNEQEFIILVIFIVIVGYVIQLG